MLALFTSRPNGCLSLAVYPGDKSLSLHTTEPSWGTYFPPIATHLAGATLPEAS